jgi:hypothetical protein
MLALKDTLIGLRLPSALDQAVHQLTIRTRTWLGGAIDANVTSGPAYTDSDLVIPKKYVIRQMTTRELDASGGRFEVGTIFVKGLVPNDPANGSIGFTPAQLAPGIVQGQEVIYLVTGPHHGEYALGELQTDRTYSYNLVLVRRNTIPIVT